MDNKKIVLIDGNSILNRAFYAIPDLTNRAGQHTNAVFGFLNILFKILEEEQASYVTVAFDRREPTFRHVMYAEYKGTRKPMPDELVEQLPLLKEVLTAMGIRTVEKAGYEADDILGTIAKTAEKEGYLVSLVSGDRDLLQIASDTVLIRIPKTKKGVTEIEDYYEKDVIEKYQIKPEQIIDWKGLMGDTSDNIPGVPGIGEKTATKIILAFQTLENAYAHIEEITPFKAKEALRNHYELAKLSKKLATIKIDCELNYQLEEAKFISPYTQSAYELLKQLEFKSILAKFPQERKGLNANLKETYHRITDLSQAELLFQTWRKEKAQKERIVGFSWIQRKNRLFGLSLTWKEGSSYFLEITGFITAEYLQQRMTEVLEETSILVTIGLKEQLSYMKVPQLGNIYDIEIAAYLLNPLKSTYGYDDIARDYLGFLCPSAADLMGKDKDILRHLEEETEESLSFACLQSSIPIRAWNEIEKRLREKQMLSLFQDMEMPLVYALFDMEQYGIRLNKEELKQYGERLAVRIEELEKEIFRLAGEEFNINSPKQLGVILFEKLHLPYGKKTKTGYSTSADILEKLEKEDPIVSMILEYRQVTKLKSTYADGLAEYINPKDGRIHGKFNQTITATGRISSTEPNLQNIPIRMELGREIRKVFIPEEGYLFLDADYSQIELRVLAHMSGDERLIEAYQQAEDIHQITASQVFHTPLEEVTKEQRSNAKAVNFGIVYGISSFGLGQGLNIAKQEAETYINQYFTTYPGVKEFMDRLVEQAKTNGFVTTLFGRIRPIPELKSGNYMQRAFGERIAMNSPIQGTAADIIKIAMLRVNKRLKQEKLKSRLILQIHDELLIETKKEEQEQVEQILKEEMLHAASLKVSLEVEVKAGASWFETK